MEQTIVNLIINLISGGRGGNIAGALFKKLSLGLIGNTLAGVVGGGLGSQILAQLGAGGGGMVGSIAGSGVGGVVLMAIIGLIKQAMSKSQTV
jgi:uncharacterized membrane protein YeaQ/YmgE (transglycosylase-associated protein family)